MCHCIPNKTPNVGLREGQVTQMSRTDLAMARISIRISNHLTEIETETGMKLKIETGTN